MTTPHELNTAMTDAALRIRVHVPQGSTQAVQDAADAWHARTGALAVIAVAPNVEPGEDGFEAFLDDCPLEDAHALQDALAEHATAGEARLFYNRPTE